MKTLLKNLCTLSAVIILWGVTASCEKAILDEDEENEVNSGSSSKAGETDSDAGNVTLRVSDFKIVPIEPLATRSMTDLTSYCTRLVFAVYQYGIKFDGCSQIQGESGYGEVTMSLPPGTYQLLVLAHSSVGGNPTVTDPENIKFTNALCYSDTFSFYGDLVVEEQPKTYDITLTRNVSCLHFTIQDEIPANVKFFKFYYTGGSGVLNAVTGYGASVNSKQEKLVDVSSCSTPLTFHLYTFLQKESAFLQLKVTALEEDQSTVVLERSFSDVPMKHCHLTEYSGNFFIPNHSFSLNADTDWGDAYYQYTF